MGQKAPIQAFSLSVDSGTASGHSSNVSLRMLTGSKKRKAQWRKFLSWISMRSIFVMITVAMVIVTGVATILTSQRTQGALIDLLTDNNQRIGGSLVRNKIQKLMDWLPQTHEAMINVAHNLYLSTSNPSNSTFTSGDLLALADIWWGFVKQRPNGATMQYAWSTGKVFGLNRFAKGPPGEYYETVRLPNSTAPTLVDWFLNDLNVRIRDINRTDFNNPTISGMLPFDGEIVLQIFSSTPCGVTGSYGILPYRRAYGGYHVMVDYHHTICGDNPMLVYTALESGTVSYLLEEDSSLDGSRTFVMDGQKMLVSSSNHTEPYTEDFVRVDATNCSVNWINEAAKMVEPGKESYSSVVIDGEPFFLGVTPYPEFNWTIVRLSPMKGFLDIETHYRNVGIAVVVAVIIGSVLVVVFVTYWLTKPLILLSQELRKVSRLELDLKHLTTPRFYEAKVLQSSFSQLHAAMRSFKKFVPAQVIINILKYNREAVSHLSPASVTIMFQDMEGFTKLSETMQPMKLAGLTEEYLEAMTDIITRHGGTVDKYIGDCIMSVFNVPEHVENHPQEACQAALECMKELNKLNRTWNQKYMVSLKIRIGINTGDVLVGNMGSEHRMNYTVVGDPVNLAARLEGVNKIFGTRIIISRSVYETLEVGSVVSRKLSTVKVSGKETETAIYEISDNKERQELFAAYTEAIQHFERFNMGSALDSINRTLLIDPIDVASIRLKKRIEASLKDPANPEWTYVETLDTK